MRWLSVLGVCVSVSVLLLSCPFNLAGKEIETSLYQDEMERTYAWQHSKQGKCIVRLRSGTVEPVFGNLIHYYGLRKIKVIGIRGAFSNMKKYLFSGEYFEKSDTVAMCRLH